MAGNKKSTRGKASSRAAGQVTLPVVFRYTEEQARLYKLEPYLGLERFRERNPRPKDWSNIILRLQIGLELIDKLFKKEDTQLIMVGINAAMEVYERWVRSDIWGAGDLEIQAMLVGLKAADEAQDNSTRREQISAYQNTIKLHQQVAKKKL